MNHGSEVVGTDISPTQPSWVPPNLRFLIENCEEGWDWPEDHFDFIHMRHMVGAISNWRKLYQEVFTHLRPGGWFQHADFDIQTRSDTGLVGPDHVYNKWSELHFQAAAKTGRSLEYPIRDGKMKDLMAETGFVDVVQHAFKVPIGGWMSDRKMRTIGAFTAEYLAYALEGFAIQPLSEVMGWDLDEIQSLQSIMGKALVKMKLQPYFML
jgi:SAM-dependent methyltransferase